jgi:hypothetical protein
MPTWRVQPAGFGGQPHKKVFMAWKSSRSIRVGYNKKVYLFRGLRAHKVELSTGIDKPIEPTEWKLPWSMLTHVGANSGVNVSRFGGVFDMAFASLCRHQRTLHAPVQAFLNHDFSVFSQDALDTHLFTVSLHFRTTTPSMDAELIPACR